MVASEKRQKMSKKRPVDDPKKVQRKNEMNENRVGEVIEKCIELSRKGKALS